MHLGKLWERWREARIKSLFRAVADGDAAAGGFDSLGGQTHIDDLFECRLVRSVEIAERSIVIDRPGRPLGIEPFVDTPHAIPGEHLPGEFYRFLRPIGCLLYTSPSPRD